MDADASACGIEGGDGPEYGGEIFGDEGGLTADVIVDGAGFEFQCGCGVYVPEATAVTVSDGAIIFDAEVRDAVTFYDDAPSERFFIISNFEFAAFAGEGFSDEISFSIDVSNAFAAFGE